MFTNDDYKDFLNEKDEDPAGDDDRLESIEDENNPNSQKKIQKKAYFKTYIKDQQEYLKSIKDPGFYREKPLDDLLKKFVLPDKQGSKY